MKPHVEANSWQVLRYLEAWHKYERMTATPDAPMNRLERGSSKPPVGEDAHDLMWGNRQASKVLEPVIREMRTHGIEYRGVGFNALLDAIRYDPGAVRRWRGLHDQGLGSPEWEALRAMCRLIAMAVSRKHDDGGDVLKLKVITDPKDAEADTPVQAAARDREARMASQREDTRQRRLKRLRAIRKKEREEYGRCSVESAMRLWQTEMDMGWDTIRRAIAGEPEEAEYLDEKGRVA